MRHGHPDPFGTRGADVVFPQNAKHRNQADRIVRPAIAVDGGDHAERQAERREQLMTALITSVPMRALASFDRSR